MTSLDDFHTHTEHATATWSTVGPTAMFPPDRGTAVLVDGLPVAMYRLEPLEPAGETEWFAVSHIDPETGAPVMARGLVSSTDDGPTISSPLSKRRYWLTSGESTREGTPPLASYGVRIADGHVQIRTVQAPETLPTHET